MPKRPHSELITAEELRDTLSYDPQTGFFRWKKRTGDKVKIGSLAGCFRKGTKTSGGLYRQIRVNNKIYLEHRLAWLYMTGEWPKEEVDHINMVRDDNRWANLREASHSNNGAHTPTRSKHGRKGVQPTKGGRWYAQAQLNKRRYALGVFDSKAEASAAYQKFVLATRGEFARTV